MSTLRLEAILDANNRSFIKVMNESVRAAKKSSKDVESTWSKANKSIGGLGAGAIGGAIGVGALAAGAREIAQMAGNINDLSEAVGLNTEDFQRFSAVLIQAGGSEELLTKGMGALISKLEDARNGSEEARDQFLRLGFTLEDIEKIEARDAILKIADALKFTTNSAQTTSRVMDLLGNKIALKMIPALKVGSAEFLETGKSAKIMSDQTIKNVDAMDDNIQQFKRDTLGQIANFFVDTKEGFKNGGSFMDGLMDLIKTITLSPDGPSPITTPAIPQSEIERMAGERNATMMDPVEVTADRPRRPGFWQTDRSSFSSALTGPGMGGIQGPGMDGTPMGATGFNGFSGGYFPMGTGGGLTSGGLTSGGLTSGGLGKGQNGDAWGKVRRGDAQRARDAASGKSKDPQLESIDKNTAALVKVWGGTGGSN